MHKVYVELSQYFTNTLMLHISKRIAKVVKAKVNKMPNECQRIVKYVYYLSIILYSETIQKSNIQYVEQYIGRYWVF